MAEDAEVKVTGLGIDEEEGVQETDEHVAATVAEAREVLATT